MNRIEFFASLYPRGQTVSFDAEGEGTVKLVAPASEQDALLLLARHGQQKAFKVIVEMEE